MKSKINDIVTYITMVAGFMTVIVGIVTITWFIRDSRKQNSKELKNQTEILLKIEEGQRKGFESLQKSLEIQTKILEKIEAR